MVLYLSGWLDSLALIKVARLLNYKVFAKFMPQQYNLHAAESK